MRNPVGGDDESMGVEHDGEGLDPCEVPGSGCGSGSDEVGVDVKVVVGNYGEVCSLGSVEVEHHSVTADEARVVAERAVSVTICFSICRKGWICKVKEFPLHVCMS